MTWIGDGKMKRVVKAILVGVLGASLCACSVSLNEESETDMGSHHVVVKPGCSFSNSSSASGTDVETYEYSCGETSVTIRNEQLVVNNVDYGSLDIGDAISIDNGKVSVDDQQRQGTPLSDQEVMESAPFKETTEELAGYGVTVRPGSATTSKTEVFDKHTLTVGNTRVAIKGDQLIVNDRPYGSVQRGDTILVESGRVFVSGDTRDAKE